MASELLAKPTWNPAEVLNDGRVIMTGVGLVAAHTKRKLAYTQFRDIFGWSHQHDGHVIYLETNPTTGQPYTKPDGSYDEAKQLPGAYGNRLLLNAADVVAGTLLIGQVQDANVDYFGLGLAAGGIANIVMTLVGIE